jgi:hypothetical protein
VSATDYFRKKALDDLTGVAPYTPPSLYLALLTADPTEAGSTASEVSAAGYVRQPLSGVMSAADPTGFSDAHHAG